MTITILDARDIGNDVLEVTGTVDGVFIQDIDERTGRPAVHEDGSPRMVPRVFTARGWVSALTHHYDPDDYGEGGHLKPDAEARAMTPDERAAFFRRMVADVCAAEQGGAAAPGRSLL